jgi:hypothetical protein
MQFDFPRDTHGTIGSLEVQPLSYSASRHLGIEHPASFPGLTFTF